MAMVKKVKKKNQKYIKFFAKKCEFRIQFLDLTLLLRNQLVS